MGLDDFKSQGSTVSQSSTSSNTSNQPQTEEKPIEDAYKVFTCDDGRKKVFQDEEEWDEAIDFIENELGVSEEKVVDMNPTQRHDVLHQAIVGERGKMSQNFYPTRQCMICDEVFSFPTKWNFSKFKGEAFCNTHTVKEVIERYREVNELVDGEDEENEEGWD